MLKTITTHATVGPDGQLTLILPPDIKPGEYSIVLVLGEGLAEQPAGKHSPLDFPVIDVGPWPEGLSLRREDMYGDDGR